MLTLIQFVNLDGIGAIYTPMVRSEPWAGLFFISFMLIVSICLMNLVTAVIVEGSFEQAKSDQIFAKKERQRAMAKLLPVVRDIFAQLDKDSSGKVTLEEFAEADETVRLALEKVCWAANKRFEISKFKFKFPRARTYEMMGIVLGCIEAKVCK